MTTSPLPADYLFVDTSICIKRLFEKSQRLKIAATCAKRTVCTGLICRQEFKRRLLGDAAYLLGIIEKRGGFAEAHHYLNGLRGNRYHQRRAGICLALMADVTGSDDREKSDRLRTKLRTLLKTGLDNFDAWIDVRAAQSKCGCGSENVRTIRRGNRIVFDIGPKSCDEVRGGCQIIDLIAETQDQRTKIVDYLRDLPANAKSEELRGAEEYLVSVSVDVTTATTMNPCLTVGDLAIALEAISSGAHTFYTMNGKESQHLCRPLGQTLIVRPADGQKEDIVCLPGESSWRDF